MARRGGFSALAARLAAVAISGTALLIGTALRAAAPPAAAPSPSAIPYACDEVSTEELLDLALEAVGAEPNGLIARMFGAAEVASSSDPGWPETLLPLLAEARSEPRDGYTVWAHIAIQNAAYRLAVRLSFELRSDESSPASSELLATSGDADSHARRAAVREAHVLALEVVDRWALPPLVLDSLADRPHPVVERWLGPAENWVERRASFCGRSVLLHEGQHFGAFAFLPVRSGSVRALIALMTAFDTEGRPHVTPLVHRIELRLGLEVTSPACVLDLDAGALDGAGDPALERVGFTDLRPSTFIRRVGGEAVGCGGCHSAGSAFNAVDVTEPAEIADLKASRRELFLTYAAERAADVRSAR